MKKDADIPTKDLPAADAVWVATALLQREHPDREDFVVPEIVEKVKSEHLTTRQPMTIYLHANQHCVANRPPNNVRLRMLVETAPGKRRLFHEGDEYHPLRAKSRVVPKEESLPSKFRPLLKWYEQWSEKLRGPWEETDPLLRLVGSGKHIWADEHADEYVNRLREGWE
jgi:hypothetical protein